ncbi:MAG: Serine-tRNA ligase [Microgenomates group bacterium GW2011_GWC1_41_20]|nr:MAG: Serine-tRNA ligase [Microgenomates group bacterium GW2011_GWC1_41_20]
MLDINFIREHKDLVKKGVESKGFDITLIDKVLDLDEKRRKLLLEVEGLRARRNRIAEEKKPSDEGKKIKEELKDKEPKLEEIQEEYKEILFRIPNLPSKKSPVGRSDKENAEIRTWGEPKKFSFKAKDHLEIGKNLKILDFETGAKVTGSQFFFLYGDGVLLELALTNFVLDKLAKKGYLPVMTPDLAKSRYYLGTGYSPKGQEAQTYTIDGTDLGLIATAEVTLAGAHSDEIIPEEKLPLKYVGYSHCFRQEAGAYGNLEEEIFQDLEIPYRVVEMCTGDLGAMAARKFDIEVWMPGRQDYGEVTSTSNVTDYQARNLNIRFRNDAGETEYVHMLNGTAVVMSRVPVAILENYQQEDGSVKIPEVLQKWMGKEKISAR